LCSSLIHTHLLLLAIPVAEQVGDTKGFLDIEN
jgi:hypothetical protein